MPAAVIPFPPAVSARRATWSLLEIARPDRPSEPLGILLVDKATGGLTLRLRDKSDFEDLEEEEADYLAALTSDLEDKGYEAGGGHALLDFLEDCLSGFLRIGERTAIEYTGDSRTAVNRLFNERVFTGRVDNEHADSERLDDDVRQFVTHLPLYGLRAAATKFGEDFDQTELSEPDSWVLAPRGLRLTEKMFVAQVVGRSMEPLIPEGSYCVFRGEVTGSRQGKRLLIERTAGSGAADPANRYTVKRYTSRKTMNPDGSWEHESITLEPLNPEFESFSLTDGDFRVIAEFVQVLPS